MSTDTTRTKNVRVTLTAKAWEALRIEAARQDTSLTQVVNGILQREAESKGGGS